LLEALNGGGIDVGQTGDTPPIFAQAAGSKLVYLAAAPDAGKRSGIVVHADGGIAKLADLRGKRVAFTRASSAHNFVVHALAAGGLTYADITPVNLQPADGAAAFRNGSVDAWGIWDPFFAIAQQDPATRVLTTSEGVAPTNSFFLARSAYADQQPGVIFSLLDTINAAADWAASHPEDLAQIMASVTGVPLEAQRVAAPRGVYAVQPMDAAIIARQQAIADTFAQLRIIPARIDVAAAVWKPPARNTKVAQ
jgi:aliphatic sulfonates family ABC transporter substrate-binding protein